MADEIAAIRRAFEAAERRGDPAVQLSQRADDAYVRMPPGRAPMGPKEAAAALEALYADGGVDVEWESDGALVGDMLAVDSGSFTVHRDDTSRTGSWVMVFRRDETDAWEVIRDIYNWDEPAP